MDIRLTQCYQPVLRARTKLTDSPAAYGLVPTILLLSSWFCRLYHCVAEKLWRTSKNYSIGRNRSVSVKKLGGDLHVTITEVGSDVKTVTFPSQRWGQFMEVLSQVDEAVDQLITKQYVHCSTQRSPRRQMLNIGDDWIRVCRHS